MTYCVSMLLDAGMVFLSDSRTNAGVDHINTFRKMSIFQRPGERVMVLMSSGNLAITQQLVSMLRESMAAQDGRENLWSVPNMFEAARHVGEMLREVEPFDLFVDAQRLGAGMKSLAFSLAFRAPDRTLKDAEIAAARDAAVAEAVRQFGAVQRA